MPHEITAQSFGVSKTFSQALDLNSTFFYLEGKITNKLCTFAPAFCLMRHWCSLSRTEPMGGALHIERRYWRFVFGLFETSTNRISNPRQMLGWHHGVYHILLRSVLWGYFVPSMHTLRVYYILLRGCFSVCLITKAVEGREQRTGMS